MQRYLSLSETKKIKKLLIDHDLKQGKIAKALSYSRPHTCMMINGKYPASEKLLSFIEQLEHGKRAA